MKYSFLLLVVLLMLLSGCGEKDKWSDKDESSDTTALSPQEVFSLTLAEDILSDDDEDLKLYLEEEIYPLVSKSNKVTIDRISSSQFLISYSQDSTYKGLLIQKYYNPLSDEIVFTKTETELKK
jgi:hypothetical protein